MRKRPNVKVIIERHKGGYVAYPIGVKGVVVGQGDTYDEALKDVRSAIRFHIETFEGNLAVGRKEKAREFILDVLGNRFGKRRPNAFRQDLQTIQNADDLTELHHKAIRCRTFGAFRRLHAQKCKAQRHDSAVVAAKQIFRHLVAQKTKVQSSKLA
jgi:predicted RNase H-like HicB family nuclease